MKKIYFERKQRGKAQNFCMRHKIGSDLIFKALELSRYFDDEVHRKPFFSISIRNHELCGLI